MSTFAGKASIDSQSALIKTFLSSLISVSVQTSAVPEPDGSLESILGKGGVSGVVNEVVTDSLTSMNIVDSASDSNGASSLESLTVTRVSVAQIFSSFISGTRGDFFHVEEGAGFFSNLTEESRHSMASVDVTPSHSFVKIGKVFGEVSLVTSRHDKLELVKAEAHGRGDSEDEGKDEKSRRSH